MSLQGAIAANGNALGWNIVAFRSLLSQSKADNRPDRPLLGVNLRSGVTRRSTDDGRPAASEDLAAYKVVAPGNIIMNRLGKPHGSVGMSAWDGITSPAYWVMVINRKLGEPRFFHHLLRSRHIVAEYERLGKNQPPNQFDISWDAFRAIEVPLPPLEEQRRIADFLDAETARIDSLAVAMHSQDASLKQRRLRVLDFAFECAPRTPLVRLGYLSSLVTSGSRGWGEFASDTGSLFFRSANLYSDRVQPKLTNVAYVQVPASATSEAQRSRIELGDVLVGITGANAGWVCMANADVAGGHVSQHVCLVRPDKRRINGDWLALLIASPAIQSRLMGNQYGGTKTQLSLPDIREIRIPVVSIEQQTQMARSISRQIDSIDRQRLLRQRQLALLTERRQALITAAVTGQFDVSTASGRNVTDGVSG